jgi:hypothetical protein
MVRLFAMDRLTVFVVNPIIAVEFSQSKANFLALDLC